MSLQTTFDFETAVPVADCGRQTRGKLAYLAGVSAEESVSRRYMRRGMTVAAQRWRGKAGEIDLVMRDGAQLIFVEVKKSKTFSRATEALSARQMRRIYNAASEFIGDEPMGQLSEVRFDVALLDAMGEIRIQENAFGHF